MNMQKLGMVSFADWLFYNLKYLRKINILQFPLYTLYVFCRGDGLRHGLGFYIWSFIHAFQQELHQ